MSATSASGQRPNGGNDAASRRPDATAAIPAYDRAGLTPGIVHFGVGNFHRAHQAVYLHELITSGDTRSRRMLSSALILA